MIEQDLGSGLESRVGYVPMRKEKRGGLVRNTEE